MAGTCYFVIFVKGEIWRNVWILSVPPNRNCLISWCRLHLFEVTQGWSQSTLRKSCFHASPIGPQKISLEKAVSASFIRRPLFYFLPSGLTFSGDETRWKLMITSLISRRVYSYRNFQTQSPFHKIFDACQSEHTLLFTRVEFGTNISLHGLSPLSTNNDQKVLLIIVKFI